MRANSLRDMVVLGWSDFTLFLELILFEQRIAFEVKVAVPGIIFWCCITAETTA